MKTTKECYMEDGKACYFAKDGECTAPKDWDCSVLEDMNTTEIPFGTDSELVEETIPIPEGCSAWIIDDKIVIKKGNFVKKKEATGVLKKLLDDTKYEREFVDRFTAYMYHPNTEPDVILACCNKLLSIAKEAFIESSCRYYCNDICEKGMTGMCFYKHNGQGQVKKDFKYNECDELKKIINEMEKEIYESE